MTTRVPGPEYEQRLMAAAEAGEPTPDIEPEEGYEMTAAFQQWLVDRMRSHVMDQVNTSGLDRMAILKPDAEPEDGD